MLPCIFCHLTDKNGNILEPSIPGSISYNFCISPFKNFSLEENSYANNCQNLIMLSVSIQGYITIFINGKKSSTPIFFCIIRNVILNLPKNSSITFITTNFQCHAKPILSSVKHNIKKVEVFVEVSFSVLSSKDTVFMICEPELCSSTMQPPLFHAEKVFDLRCFKGDTIVTFDRVLKSEVCNYITLSNGEKREYTNQDALTEYHSCGILPPEMVSYYNVFVNGVLQPHSNYTISEGSIKFDTEDVPPKDAFIIIEFITSRDSNNEVIPADIKYYVALSNDNKKLFTDADALLEYGDKGIPSPNEVSYLNFYINGVIQPKANYTIKKGELRLISTDLPPDSSFLVLESIILKPYNGQLFQADLEQYNALSYGSKKYTNYNELKEYGSYGIPDPENTSYQHLFINGLLQPPINYRVEEGLISLETEDAPIINAPVILQSISFLSNT